MRSAYRVFHGRSVLTGFAAALGLALLFSGVAEAQPGEKRRIQYLSYGPDGVECIGDENLCEAVSKSLMSKAADRTESVKPQSSGGVEASNGQVTPDEDEEVGAGDDATTHAETQRDPFLAPVQLAPRYRPTIERRGPVAPLNAPTPVSATTAVATPSGGPVLTRCVRGSGSGSLGEKSYTLTCVDVPLGEDDVVYLSQPGQAPMLLAGRGA